ncbi:MAG: PfkB family carbohydrate kinase [Microbacteriaceae bacterium]
MIGESLTDVIVAADGSRTALPGGSPMNVAYGLGRLGLPTTFATRLGRDPEGDAIRTHVASAGVRILDDRPASATSHAIARIDAHGAAHYRFAVDWEFEARTLPAAAHVHAGSLGAFLPPGGAAVQRYVESLPREVLVSFDPNIRAALLPPELDPHAVVQAYCRRADVVKLSDEDSAWLFPGVGAREVLEWILGCGAAIAVMTRGAAGSLLLSRRAMVTQSALPTTVADTIGAGDAFMAGLIGAIWLQGLSSQALRDADPEQLGRIGRFAAAAAALTVARPGAALPSLAEMEAALQPCPAPAP